MGDKILWENMHAKILGEYIGNTYSNKYNIYIMVHSNLVPIPLFLV